MVWSILGPIIVCLVTVPILWAIYGRPKMKEKQAYLDALEELKQHPNDSALREKVIELGWYYIKSAVNEGGYPMFTEATLMNDVNAATAQDTTPHSPNEKPHNESAIQS